MAINQQINNQKEIIEKMQSSMLETLNKEKLEVSDFQKIQCLSVALKAAAEVIKTLNTIP
jgi:hypothetical protein